MSDWELVKSRLERLCALPAKDVPCQDDIRAALERVEELEREKEAHPIHMACPSCWSLQQATQERAEAAEAEVAEESATKRKLAGMLVDAEAEIARLACAATGLRQCCEEQRAEVERLRERLAKWESQDIHESMGCYKENARLRGLLAEWIPRHSAACCTPTPELGTFPPGPFLPKWCRCNSLSKRSRAALAPEVKP